MTTLLRGSGTVLAALLALVASCAPVRAQTLRPAVDQQATRVGENERAAVLPGPHFTVSADFGERRRDFKLFKDTSLAGWDGGMDRLDFRFRQLTVPGPRLVGLPTLVLGVAIRDEPTPEGGRRLVFDPVIREWSNLTPWEKLSVALSYAGAAAAAVHFAAQIAKTIDH